MRSSSVRVTALSSYNSSMSNSENGETTALPISARLGLSLVSPGCKSLTIFLGRPTGIGHILQQLAQVAKSRSLLYDTLNSQQLAQIIEGASQVHTAWN